MNIEQHTPETLSAILAEMRNPPLGDETPASLACRMFADRVKRAAEREREIASDLGRIDRESDNMARAADALEKAVSAPGNAAAMRHALGIVYDWILKAGNVYGYSDSEQKRRQLYDMMTKALSAPARNCDISRDTKETIERCLASLNVESSSASFDAGVCAAIGWMLAATAEGGDHA